MNRMFLYSYHSGSSSAKKLAMALGARRIRHQGSKFRGRPGTRVINWGAARLPPAVWEANVLNRHVLADKLAAFERVGHDPYVVPWTTSKGEASEWMDKRARMVVARTLLRSHSGRGIVVCGPHDDLVDAPLYTQYIKKKDEYRVHITNKGDVLVDRKARRLECKKPNWKIRNHCNGFVYVAADEGDPSLPIIINVAYLILTKMKYDFGAVDILWNEHEGKPYVCEVNAAPGLENTRTLEFYTHALHSL